MKFPEENTENTTFPSAVYGFIGSQFIYIESSKSVPGFKAFPIGGRFVFEALSRAIEDFK